MHQHKRKINVDTLPPTKSKRAKNMLQDWVYGVGQEGTKAPPGVMERINAVIVDTEFPWWYTPAMSVEFNVTNVWLNIYKSIENSIVATRWCKGANVESAGVPSDAFIVGMHQADVILINGNIPACLEERGLWTTTTGSKLRLVVYTEPTRHLPRRPWRLVSSVIDHSKVGGVTNGIFTIFAVARDPIREGECRIPLRKHIEQDLQWILKSKERGKLTTAPKDPTPMGGVQWYKRGVIYETSKLPWIAMDTQVITKFRHNQWVVRSLTVFERLLALDVSEQLIKSLPDEKDRVWLLQVAKLPLKVLQYAAEHYSQVLRESKAGDSKVPFNSVVIKKGKRDWQVMVRDTSVHEPSTKLLGKWSKGLPSVDGECVFKEDEEVGGLDSEFVTGLENMRASSKTNANATATKSDDAKVRVNLWNDRILQIRHAEINPIKVTAALNTARRYLLQVWKRRVVRSFKEWVRLQENTQGIVEKEVMEAGRDCCRRAYRATWWNWDGGSRPFFWRWPPSYQSYALNGVSVWFRTKIEKWTKKQREPKNEKILELMRRKIDVVREKEYVEQGHIDSLMSFFDVPKGTEDIRMVYDGTKSGLNDSLWAPWFPLPTADWLIRSLEPGYYMADNDVGEMFHNFVLHKDLRQYCGLDLTVFYKGSKDVNANTGKLWERWNRLAMGLRNSPYNAVQGMMIAKDVIVGDPTDERNVFRWDHVETNLPGSNRYDPSKSWIVKVRKDGSVAADVFIYVDDIRTSAPTEKEAWEASQRTSATLGYLGLQDAARKRRQPSQEAGAWTGSIVWTSSGEVVAMTTQEKWDKTRGHIKWMSDNLKNPKGLNNKMLKSIRGFLVYVARTYHGMVPYLKGIHATIDSWRSGRNIDGWKYTEQKGWTDELDPLEFERSLGMTGDSGLEPEYVQPVPRLVGDIACLINLTSFEEPPCRRVRMVKEGRVMYGFGDASKQGFGASVELADKSVMWRSGKFSTFVQERSSNYRELLNLVEYIEEIFNKGLLDGCELFMFTDNFTAEAAFFKGTSSSELLFGLVLRLRKIEMTGRCMLHMIHVAGTRMICQGTDGLSRGDRNSGIMAGESMLSFLPLHLPANQRSTSLLPWCMSWLGPLLPTDPIVKVLEVDDWYKPITNNIVYVWLPPPAVADVAVELMAQGIHKQPYSTHVFLCPRLMTARWMRLIMKATDATWRIPTGSPIWDISNHEPLVLSIYFPLRRNYPWRNGQCTQFLHESKLVQAMLASSTTKSGIMLRELSTRTRNLAGV